MRLECSAGLVDLAGLLVFLTSRSNLAIVCHASLPTRWTEPAIAEAQAPERREARIEAGDAGPMAQVLAVPIELTSTWGQLDASCRAAKFAIPQLARVREGLSNGNLA